MMKQAFLVAVVALVLAGCGTVSDESPEVGAEELGTNEAAATTYPTCCSAIPGSGYTEAFCDSVAYSPLRCNSVWSGTACQWSNTNCPVTCCQPKSGSTVPWNYCNPYAISADRCNQVNGGTTCAWAC